MPIGPNLTAKPIGNLTGLSPIAEEIQTKSIQETSKRLPPQAGENWINFQGLKSLDQIINESKKIYNSQWMPGEWDDFKGLGKFRRGLKQVNR